MTATTTTHRHPARITGRQSPLLPLLTIIGLWSIGGCDGNTPDPSTGPDMADPDGAATPVLARVDGATITTADLERAILSTPRPEQLEYINPPQRQELLEALIDRKLIAHRARNEGLDREPAIAERLTTTDTFDQERLLAQAFLDRYLEGQAITDDDIAADYQARSAEFTEPERAFVTRAVRPDETNAAVARQSLLDGADVNALQQQAADRGQTSQVWLAQRGEAGPMEQAAFSLEPGQVSAVFPIRGGWATLRVEEHKPARLRPLAEVRDGIAARLDQARRAQTRQELLENLRKNAAVTVDSEALANYQWQD